MTQPITIPKPGKTKPGKIRPNTNPDKDPWKVPAPKINPKPKA